MKTVDFMQILKEALDFQQINFSPETNLKAIDGFDSMSIMTIIAIVDEHFSKKLTARQLASITTVGSLIELIGKEKFVD
jgi:acyl carrier protein